MQYSNKLSMIRRQALTVAALLALVSPLHPQSIRAAGPRSVTATSPASVNLAGDLQTAATSGACGTWDPGCPASALTAAGNDVYVFTSSVIPAGAWNYKIALGSWAESYGADFKLNGPNIALTLAAPQSVRFYYDHKTHYIADNVRNTIYTIPGSFNSEIGCAGDWAPDCLATLMTDVDGDGIFTYVTSAIPAGSYEFKIATNESWSNPNYGQGGGGNNVPFTVPANGIVTISFNTATNTPSVKVESALPSHDNNVEWDGLRHDSRDSLYRTPSGAVPVGTDVRVRLRTYHNDVTGVNVRIYDVNANGQRFAPMHIAAADEPCFQSGLETKRCDYWEATLSSATPNNLWYRFVINDGSATAHYADNTAALDGGLGAVTANPVDQSFALMFYDPAFTAPSWAKNATIYQIFPDRFRNGNKRNDPKTGDVRYDDPVVALPWNSLPEGYCRNYTDGATNCPWRYDANPPASSPTKESPRGRDYFGGDLEGVKESLEYLQSIGVNTIYFNPIFAAKSNHRYDTADYTNIDPALGNNEDFRELVKEARGRGIRIILDGVFNHMSSDSAFFDRYRHFATVGACEASSSVYRNWFGFRAPAGLEPSPCAPTTAGGADTYYNGWFGFDSIPVLNKANPAVQSYFVNDPNSISKLWLKRGAAGWRLDVMGDASFPSGYWESFRNVVKTQDPNALIISELWQKDSTLLRFLRGNLADSTMNYRLRDAVIGLLTPGSFDSKGFGDSGRILAPSEFASRISSIREDYPDAAYYSLMNLLDSHDTERILWTLTPGAANRAEKEFNAANLATGKRSVQLASLIQFTLPGAPTVYYGDEVGMTGGDDPDDRRTFPWPQTGGVQDNSLKSHYSTLAALRASTPALVNGDLRMLTADDATGLVAYGRKSGDAAAVVVINRSTTTTTTAIQVTGFLPDGVLPKKGYTVGAATASAVASGSFTVTIAPRSATILTVSGADLTGPSAPTGLAVTAEGRTSISLSWNAVSGASGYVIYRSVVSGGGYVKVGSSTTTAFVDSGLTGGHTVYYVIKARDGAGNEGTASNETAGLPHPTIGWANTQWPPSINHTISAVNRTPNVYGQIWIDGLTNVPGPTPGLLARIGFGPVGTNPAGAAGWVWGDATFNADAGNNDEYKASLLPEAVGSYDYVYRYSTTNGRDWLVADFSGPVAAGALPSNPGKLSVASSGDTTAPASPTNLVVTAASPAGIQLAWDAVTDASLYGYEVLRGDSSGGPYVKVGQTTVPTYLDLAITQGATYYYVVRSLDLSFNRSGNSNELRATAELRTVTLTFNVTAAPTAGRSVYIAGFLDRLDGGLPQWNPGGVVLSQTAPNTWTITLTGTEGTQIEYKYALGSWDFVEKDATCGEVANRQLTLVYGVNGVQTVADTASNWRNIAPCGN